MISLTFCDIEKENSQRKKKRNQNATALWLSASCEAIVRDYYTESSGLSEGIWPFEVK